MTNRRPNAALYLLGHHCISFHALHFWHGLIRDSAHLLYFQGKLWSPVRHICRHYLLSAFCSRLSCITAIPKASQSDPALENCPSPYMAVSRLLQSKILGSVSIFTVSPIMPFVFTTSVTLGNLVMNPTFLSHKTWSVCCSQHIWDLISSGMTPDSVPWTRQKVTRIKVSLEHWLNVSDSEGFKDTMKKQN